MTLEPQWLRHDPEATPTAKEVAEARRVHLIDFEVEGGTGSPGPAGKSAYQVWLDQGHLGSEADFLNSLEGAKGDPGPPGRNGIDGADGSRGPEGPAGQSITIAGYVDKLADLPTDLTEANAGESWITMEFGHLHFWTGTEWTDGGEIVGPAGRDGVDGSPGRQGDPGETGPAGPGVPAGGTTGQILEKSSNSDYDTQWVANDHRHPVVVEGDLSEPDSRLEIVLSNIRVIMEYRNSSSHRVAIATVTGEEVVDFRLDSHYDGSGSDHYTLDETLVTTTENVVDGTTYDRSRNPTWFLLRENGRVWEGRSFVSGPSGQRATMWAQRIV